MVARETNYRARSSGNEVLPVIQRRYMEVNGGRQAFQIIVDQEGGAWEVGPFKHDGADIQFGSLDAENPFDGTFSALISRTLRPGTVSWRADDEEDVTVRGLMSPRCEPTDYAGEIAAGALHTIYHIDGAAGRIRILLAEFDQGTGGDLAIWVL